MNSLARKIHDAHAVMLKSLGVKLKTREIPRAEDIRASGIIQTAGSCTLDNSLEADFYGTPEKNISYSWDEVPWWRIRDARLVGDNGQIFLADGSFLLASVHPQQNLLHRFKIRRPIRTFEQKLKAPVFHLTGRNHENRGHFLLQHLPRIMAARALLEKIGDYRILVAPNHARWQKNMLELVGFDPARVIEGSQGTISVEDLIYVPHIYGSNALVRPDLCREICAYAGKVHLPAPVGPPIFISRQDAPDKKLLNEPRIIEIAREVLGSLEVIELRKFPLKEQVALYRRAPVIIGAIGQGLCNVVLTTGRLFISLKPGLTVSDYFHSGHTTTVANVCGNQAITFFSNESIRMRGSWGFPEERFREQLTRLMRAPRLKPIVGLLERGRR
ncbi:MAG: glycosyltransferase 61 family protein [Verrucomicrobiota bacterium]